MPIAVPLRQKPAPGNRTTGVPKLISQHNPVGYFTHEYNWTPHVAGPPARVAGPVHLIRIILFPYYL